MVTCQSANQLKTPAKVSWAFKMVSQFGSLGYTIMGKTADLTVVQKTIIDTLHKEGKPQTFIAKEAGCSQSAVSKHAHLYFISVSLGNMYIWLYFYGFSLTICVDNRINAGVLKNENDYKSSKWSPTNQSLLIHPCIGARLNLLKNENYM